MAGEYPVDENGSFEKINHLRNIGFDFFINLTEQKIEGLYDYRKFVDGIYAEYPIQDVMPPNSVEYTNDIIDQIDFAIEQGYKVYIHCKGGSGRTGTIVACWLVEHGHTAKQALNKVAKWWKKAAPKSPWKSPNTPAQCQFVMDYAQQFITVKERYQGCLAGLAVGDALGTTNEFKTRGSFEPITDMVGGGVFGLNPGEWTDDTSMALCLGQSLIDRDGFNAHDQLNRYYDWYSTGYMSSNGRCFDIGNATRHALTSPACLLKGSPIYKNAAGNGGIMRLAPVPMFYGNFDIMSVGHYSKESSRVTHGHKDADAAAYYFGRLLWKALNGYSKTEILAKPQQKGLSKTIYKVAAGSYKNKIRGHIKSSCYVVDSLEAALWCFYHTDTFAKGALLAANLGDDADTVAAIYGQLAGAYYGINSIPARWLNKLAEQELIIGMADKLFNASR